MASINEFLNVLEVLSNDDALLESKKIHLKQYLYSFSNDPNILNDIKIGIIGKTLATKEKFLQPLLLCCDSKLKSQYYLFMVEALMKISENSLVKEYMTRSEKELALMGSE